MRFVIVFLIGLLLAIPSSAQGTFTLGADGYYYQNGVPHTRVSTWNAGYYTYDGCGRAYFNQGYYSHVYTPVVVTQKTSTITYQTPDWRSKLLDLKAAQNKANAALLKDAFEQQYFLESVRQLGFEGAGYAPAFPLRNFSLGGGYASSVQFGAFGNNASTIYGVSHFLDAYGDTSPIALFQAASQHVSAAQSSSDKAVTGFQGLVKTDSEARARVAETLARAEATQRYLQALTVPQAKLITTQTQIGGNPPSPQVPVMPQASDAPQSKVSTADGYQAWVINANTKCAACHYSASGDVKALKGGFDVSTFPALSVAERGKIVREHLLTDDPNKLMPRDATGKGVKLPQQEIALWMQDFVPLKK